MVPELGGLIPGRPGAGLPPVGAGQLTHSLDGDEADFPAAVPLGLPPADDSDEDRPEAPQLTADGLGLVFALVRIGPKLGERRRSRIPSRSDRGSQFEKLEPLRVSNAWVINFLSDDGRRSYVATQRGVEVANRQELGGPFGFSGMVQTLLASQIGRWTGRSGSPQRKTDWFSAPRDSARGCSTARSGWSDSAERPGAEPQDRS